MSECGGHVPMRDFKSSAHEWICSGCGKVGVWGDEWSYFGAIGCRKCGQGPVIEFVACSESCRLEYERGKRVVSKTLVQQSINRLDEQIARLQQQKETMSRKLEKASRGAR